MNKREFNAAFFSYEGTINRKDYAINMLILISLFIGLSLIRPEAFVLHTSLKFLAIILSFLISMLKFVTGFSILSQIYRRNKDIAYNKSEKTRNILNKLFIFIYAVPIILYYSISILFGGLLPLIANLAPFIITIMFPIMLIYAIVIGFIKSH